MVAATPAPVHLRRLPAPVNHPLVLHPIVEFLVPLAKRPHVHVKHSDTGIRQPVPHQVRVLGRVHTAHTRAVRHAAVRVTGTHTLDEHDVFRLLPVDNDLAHRGAGGRRQPLELDTRHHLWVHPVAELGLDARVDQIKASSHDDGIHVQVNKLVLLIIVNGIRLAEIRTRSTPVQRIVEAMLAINHRYLGHRLGKRNIDIASLRNPHVEL